MGGAGTRKMGEEGGAWDRCDCEEATAGLATRWFIRLLGGLVRKGSKHPLLGTSPTRYLPLLGLSQVPRG